MNIKDERSFGEFTLRIVTVRDGEKLRLYRNNELVKIDRKALRILEYLTSFPYEPGRKVSKDEILEKVWGEGDGSPAAVDVYIRKIRVALGDVVEAPVFIKTHPKEGYEFLVSYHSTQSESVEAKEIDPLEIFRRELVHRYHLTLNEEGNPVWLYTILDFTEHNSKATKHLQTDASILPAPDANRDDHRYRWRLEGRGEHIVIQTQHYNFESDIGVEVYPNASRRQVMFGSRINETWRKTLGPKVADSITILSIREPLPLRDWAKEVLEGEPLPEIFKEGPLPGQLSGVLERKWLKGAKSDIIRLPELPGDGTTARLFSNFPEVEAELLQRMPTCKYFRLSLSWFPRLGDSQRIFGELLPTDAQLEFLISHPDCVFAGYRGLAVHKDSALGAINIRHMRRLLRVLKRTHPNLTLKLTDLPIPNAYIELNKRDIFFSMLWANGNAVEGPWCMTSVDSSFGKSLAEQFQWMWGNHKDSDYPGFFGRRPAQDDDLEEAPPPLVGNVGEGAGRIEVAAHGPIVKEGPQIHSTSVRMFWEKYLEDDSRKRLLYYGEPLFWRDKHHRVYGRTVGKEHFDGYAGDEISVYPFLDAGEVRCAISFIRWFRSQGVRLQEKSTRHAATIAGIVDDPEEREAHGIVLGLPDVNGLVHGYHRFDDFVFKVVTAGGNTGIARKNEQPPLKYADAGDEEGQTKAFVLVSRRPGREPDTVVTIISSAITRAIEGIGDLLTSERGILGLRKKISFVDPWPSVFQLVFSVTLDNEGAVADQQLHDWWPKPFK